MYKIMYTNIALGIKTDYTGSICMYTTGECWANLSKG